MAKGPVNSAVQAYKQMRLVKVESIGAEAANARRVVLQVVAADDSLEAIRERVRVRVTVCDAQYTGGASATATLAAATGYGTALAGSGTSELHVESNENGEVWVDVTEAAAGVSRYLRFDGTYSGPFVQAAEAPIAMAFA